MSDNIDNWLNKALDHYDAQGDRATLIHAIEAKIKEIELEARLDEFTNSVQYFTYGAKKRAMFNQHLAELKNPPQDTVGGEK